MIKAVAAGPYLAVDWGTTNRRAWRVGADGEVEDALRDGQGILSVAPGGYPAAAAAIRARLGDLPMLCAGMVGSNRGWVETLYLPCPVELADIARALNWVEPKRTAILPGVANERPDVMRGEEVQLLGAVAAGLAPADALLCQPGTHCKWAEMAGGALASFVTAMTGELFALLKQHSLIAPQLAGEAAPGPAFADGVRDGGGDLLARLFGIRAAALRGGGGEGAAYASGLLIGTDVRARNVAGRDVHVLADPALGALYGAAIDLLGGKARRIDSDAAFLAGINGIWSET
jgi:2-dehydro-3-deoxygalactonokinase